MRSLDLRSVAGFGLGLDTILIGRAAQVLGMFGIPQFRAIINPPEAAILAVGSIVKRPVVIDDGIHIRPIMVITCSADHRILDGVSVAKFLQDIKTALERVS